MSITRDNEEVIFHCDGIGCHEHLNTEEVDFSLARIIRDEAGWTLRKVHNQWLEICPDCNISETEGLV